VAVAKITERNGDIVGALTVDEDDEVLVIMGKGNIVRMPVGPVTRTGRHTQGMRFANPGAGDSVVAVARNPERAAEEVVASAGGDSVAPDAVPSSGNEQVSEASGPEVPGPEAEVADEDSTGGSE
jgi:DNA gyrase subunit A